MKKSKIQTIFDALQRRSLNRFEAEKLGDHCLNSTISELRKDGHTIIGEWEYVPNRFGGTTKVKRYFLTGGMQ